MSALYAWCICEGLAETNPVAGSNDPGAGREARDRVLSDAELRSVWLAADPDVLNDFGAIARLLILTGCRRQEIGGLSWGELDLATGRMTIPGARVKGGKTLELTLPAPAIDILHTLPRQAGNPRVFGTARCGFSAWSSRFSALCLLNRKTRESTLAGWRRAMPPLRQREGREAQLEALQLGLQAVRQDAVPILRHSSDCLRTRSIP